MPTTFNVIYLGNFAALDPNEGGDETAENAASLVGTTIGSSGAPLLQNVQEFSPGSTGFAATGYTDAYDNDNTVGVETFSIDGGPDQTFDAVVVYDATITYSDGTTATISAVIVQDSSGNTYLAPEPTTGGNPADQTAMEAKSIESITLDAVSNDSPPGFAADRAPGDFKSPDGVVEGTAGDDVFNIGDLDADGDYVDGPNGNDDVIYARAGNDTISAGADSDTVYGGAGNDSIVGGPGNDVLWGDTPPGMEFNATGTDGATSAASLDDFPTAALTYEITFSSTDTGVSPLASYATPTENNEFLIVKDPSDILTLNLGGGFLNTDVDLSPYFDGDVHTLAFTWDSTTGAFEAYGDGVAIYSGNVSAGATLDQGGTFVIGQDQDVVGGGFDPTQIFDGEVYGVSLYDDVRSASEIAGNAGIGAAPDQGDVNLISNWLPDPAGTLIDATGNHDMTASGDVSYLPRLPAMTRSKAATATTRSLAAGVTTSSLMAKAMIPCMAVTATIHWRIRF